LRAGDTGQFALQDIVISFTALMFTDGQFPQAAVGDIELLRQDDRNLD